MAVVYGAHHICQIPGELKTAAPSVEGIVKRLRDYRCADPWAVTLMLEAAALLVSAHARGREEGLEAAAKVIATAAKPTEPAEASRVDALIDDMLHGAGIPFCDEWDRLTAHARQLERELAGAKARYGSALDDARMKSMMYNEVADELSQAKRKITELEENERAYERILGPKSYQEVADELSQAKRDAERYRWLRSMAGSKGMCEPYYGERLDEGCDAALAKREGEGK